MSRMSWPLTLLLSAPALLAGCEPPPVIPTADRRQHTLTSRVEGEVLVTGGTRGNAVLFLFDAARPPPPQGTGRPLAFTFIPGDKLFGAALDDGGNVGPFVAAFRFSQVPAGRYLVRGFIDARGALSGREPDFIPWYGVTAEMNQGDLGGAFVDPVTRSPRVVTIEPAADGSLPPATGVTVLFQESGATVVPVDRPAFRIRADSAVFSPRMLSPASNRVIGVELAPLREGLVDQRAPQLLLRYQDEDRDGIVDTVNGVPQLWPRVIVRKLADTDNPALLIEQNDLDRNGILDTEGFADYPHLDLRTGQTLPPDGLPDLVVLGAGWLPSQVASLLNDPSTGRPRTEPDPTSPTRTRFITVPVAQLSLVLGTRNGPLAFDAANPAAPVPLAQIPTGRYAIVLIQQTGQTWRVPNELNPSVAPSLGLPAVESQGFVLEVSPP